MSPRPTLLGPGLARPARLALVALGVGLAAACSPGLDEHLRSYHAEVCRWTDGPCDPGDPVLTTALPGRRNRVVEVPASEVRFFDFLSLQGCRLGELAGYRNSPLGRVMPATRRYRYEAEVHAAGRTCLDSLEDGTRDRLASLIADKEAALPLHRWNAVWTSEEFEAYWSLASPVGRRAPADRAAPLLARVTVLATQPHHPPEAAVELEDLVAQLARTAPVGPRLRALDEARHHLSRVAQRLEGFPGEGCPVPAVRLVRTFQGAYLQGVQPALSRVDREVAGLAEPLAALAVALPPPTSLPDAMTDYLRETLGPGESSLWHRYREALRVHARAWQPLLQECGVLPDATDRG
ncbi:MAG: DUF3080 family protein [Myxococcota bacterium]